MSDKNETTQISRAEQARINGAKSNHAILLRNEDPAAFQLLHAAYQRRLDPSDPFEQNLVRELCSLDWILVRTRAVQASILNMAMARLSRTPDDPSPILHEDERLATAFQDASKSSPALSLSQRQIDSIIRARRETLAALSQLRQDFPSPERTRDLPFLATNSPQNEPENEPENQLPEVA